MLFNLQTNPYESYIMAGKRYIGNALELDNFWNLRRLNLYNPI
jgi:hypothetical protein